MTPRKSTFSQSRPEQGGITIMVSLLLLVLLTITSLAMSKSAVRSAIATGSLRQSYATVNTADAGIEWAIFWLTPDPNNPATRPAATGGAAALQTSAASLILATKFGIPGSTVTNADMTLPAVDAASQKFDVTLTLMGQVAPGYTGFMSTPSSTTATSAQALYLWCITTNGYMTYPGGPTFTQRREVWLTTPPM